MQELEKRQVAHRAGFELPEVEAFHQEAGRADDESCAGAGEAGRAAALVVGAGGDGNSKEGDDAEEEGDVHEGDDMQARG